MSLQVLLNVTRCPQCGLDVPRGKAYKDRPKLCQKCANAKKYQRRKLLLKLGRQKKRKCHSCGGVIGNMFGVYCTPYCRWITSLRHRHYKIILRMGDLK